MLNSGSNMRSLRKAINPTSSDDLVKICNLLHDIEARQPGVDLSEITVDAMWVLVTTILQERGKNEG